jgi:anti-sigma B factor antagonist
VTAAELIHTAPAGFGVGVEPARETVRIVPVGELDLASVPVLGAQIRELVEVGFEQLVVDLRGLSFIDVSGLRLLLGFAQRARCEGWRLSLIQGSDSVQRIFSLTGTFDRLPFSPAGEVAIKHVVVEHGARGPRDRSPVHGVRAGLGPRPGIDQRWLS